MNFDENALTAQDVASILKIGKNMVYTLAKTGQLGSYSVGRKLRFTMTDVDAYIQARHDDATYLPAAANKETESETMRGGRSAFRIAGDDVTADIVANYLGQAGLDVQRTYEPDHQALLDVYYGKADAACVSLFDRKTNRFNIPYIQRLVPGTSVVALHLVKRNSGLLVRNGNPKGIRRWCDLLRDGVSTANMRRGTSARVMLDEHLLALGAGIVQPKGYEREFASPIAAAAFVAQGGADCMVGDERVFHQVDSLDFLALAAADVDIMVAKTPQTAQTIKFLHLAMKTEAFAREVGAIPGTDVSRTGEVSYEV